MDKYEILAEKLNSITKHIDNMIIKNRTTMQYLQKYQMDVKRTLKSVENKTIEPSRGALLGLLRGVSDYDEICNDIKFLKMLADADRYYSEDCYKF